MLSVIINLSLVAVFLGISEYITRKSKATSPELRKHLIRVSRGVSLFSVVAVLQLCEALAPDIMSAGTVGLMTLSLEVLGIVVGLGMILNGMSRWSAGAGRGAERRPGSQALRAAPADGDDYRLAFRAVSRVVGAMRRKAAAKEILDNLSVIVAELTRSRSVVIDRVGNDGRRKRIGSLCSRGPVEVASAGDEAEIPTGWGTAVVSLDSAGARLEIGWDGRDYGKVEREAVETACECARLELLKRYAESTAESARCGQSLESGVLDAALSALNGSESVPVSGLCERLFELLRDKVAPRLGCDVVMFDWHSKSSSEIRSLWQETESHAPSRAFWPVTQRIPVTITSKQPIVFAGRLPRFDTRPGGERLTRLGLKSLVTAGLYDGAGELRAQVTFGFRSVRRLTTGEKSFLTQAVGSCARLLELVEERPTGYEIRNTINEPEGQGRGTRINMHSLATQTEEMFL